MNHSHHCPLYLSLKTKYKRKLPHGRFNSSILNKQRTEQLTKDISDCLEFNDNGEVSPSVLCDTCKAVIRGKEIAFTPLLMKQRLKKTQHPTDCTEKSGV